MNTTLLLLIVFLLMGGGYILAYIFGQVLELFQSLFLVLVVLAAVAAFVYGYPWWVTLAIACSVAGGFLVRRLKQPRLMYRWAKATGRMARAVHAKHP